MSHPRAQCQIKSLFDTDQPDGFAELPQSIDFGIPLTADRIPQIPARIVGKFPAPKLDQQLPIAASIDTIRLRAIFQSLIKQNPIELESDLMSDTISESQTLVARWIGVMQLTPPQVTKLRLHKHPVSIQHQDRPANSHFDLVWTGSTFELRRFHFVPPRRCQFAPTLSQSDAIRLYVVESSHSLILIPEDQQRLGFNIVVSADGTATIANSFVALPEH